MVSIEHSADDGASVPQAFKGIDLGDELDLAVTGELTLASSLVRPIVILSVLATAVILFRTIVPPSGQTAFGSAASYPRAAAQGIGAGPNQVPLLGASTLSFLFFFFLLIPLWITLAGIDKRLDKALVIEREHAR